MAQPTVLIATKSGKLLLLLAGKGNVDVEKLISLLASILQFSTKTSLSCQIGAATVFVEVHQHLDVFIAFLVTAEPSFTGLLPLAGPSYNHVPLLLSYTLSIFTVFHEDQAIDIARQHSQAAAAAAESYTWDSATEKDQTAATLQQFLKFELPTLSWFVLAPGLASFSAPPPHAAACLLNLQGMSPAAVAPRLGSQVVLGLSEHQRSNPESRRAEVGSGIPQSSDTLVSLWSDRWYEELIVSACAFMWQEGASQAGPGMGILQDQAFLPPSSVTRQQQQQGVITRPATRPSATAAEREPSLSEESQGPTTSCISKRKAKAPEDSPGRGQRPSASESDAAEAAGARVWQRFHWKPLTGEGEGGMPLPSAPGTAEGSATSMSPSLILIRGDAVPSSGYPGPSDTWLATAVLPCANIEWSTLSNAAMKWLRNIGVCQLPSGHSSLFWCFQFIVPMHAFAVGSGMEEGTAAVCLQGPRCAAALHRLGIEEEPLVSAAAACEARLSSFIGILSAAEISASSPSSSPEAHLDHVSLMLKSAYTKRMWEADTSTPRQKAAAAAAAHASQPDIGSPADLKRPSRRGNALETPLPRGIESRGSVNSDIRSAMRALDVAAQTPLQVEELAAAADANGPQQAARHGHRVRTKGLHPDHLPRGLMIRYQQELEEALPRDQAVAGKVPHTPPGKPSNPRPKPQARGYQRPGRRLVNGTESGRPERGRQDRVPPNAKFQRPRPPSAEAPAPSTPLRAHSPIRASPRRHSGSSIPATPSAISAVVDGLITPATPRSNHSASKPLTFGSEARKPPLADRGSGALGVAAGRGRERRAVGHLDGEKEEGSGAGAGGGTGKYGAAKLSGEVGYSQDTLYLAMKTPTPRRGSASESHLDSLGTPRVKLETTFHSFRTPTSSIDT